MVAPTEFDPNPDNNTTIGGLNVGENCPAANMNNVVRYIAAAVRVTYNAIPNSTQFVATSNGVFQTRPIINQMGGILNHNDPNNTSGRIYIVPDGQTPAGLLNGDIIIGV